MTKRWYESTAVWGGIVAIISVALQLLGKSISPDDQNNLAQQLALIGGAAGGVLAIVGRIKAVVPMAGGVAQLLASASGFVGGLVEARSSGCNHCKPLTGIVQGPHAVDTPESAEEAPPFIKIQAGCASTDPACPTVKTESQTS